MKYILVTLVFLISSILPNSSYSKCNPLLIREEVMAEGMVIKAITHFGLFEIIAGKGCKRTYTWDNQSYSTELIPRKERWYGKLGLYHPQMRPTHKNVVHMIAEEYQINYDSEQEAIESMNPQQDLYNDQGLHLRFIKRDGPGGEGNIFISVTVSQILINGKKPTILSGSENDKINIETKNKMGDGARYFVFFHQLFSRKPGSVPHFPLQ